jgi:tetratricopeptide (TPR) repeat protein
LRYLVENPRRLVTQEELVNAVWGKTAISDSVLRSHIRELRQVLGSGIIETVVGRGYRFLVDVQESDASEEPYVTVPDAPTSDALLHCFVGREAEFDVLKKALQKARDGKRQLVFVTGEAGVGKTTLVDSFLNHAATLGNVWCTQGSCVEHYGSGEAYLPVVAALGRLCRSPGGEHVVDVLSRYAPPWFTQMPAHVTGDRVEELRWRVAGATQARMLLALAEALEALSRDKPVVLALDDLQWSDPSTVELLALLGRRRDSARLLVVGTYRATELARSHPLTKVIGELVAHKQAADISLHAFSEENVAEYAYNRFVGNAFPCELSRTIYRTTGGNALFVVTLFDDLEGRQMIRSFDGHWELATSIEDVASRRPDSIRRLLDVQIDRFSVTEQRVVEAASVAGNTFAVGVVAHALDMPVDEVEPCCESLANEHRFLRYLGTETWSDGTHQSRYGFVHALFQHAALARNTSVRLWHRRIAQRLEAGYRDDADAIALQLAGHFDLGSIFDKAAEYYARAGERALRRHGSHEALGHFERAHALIGRLPEGRERDEFELRVLHGLQPCLFAARVFAADEFAPTFMRAAELARHLNKDEHLCAALLGLQRCRLMKGELRQVSEHADEITRLASGLPDTSLGEAAACLSAFASLYRGRLTEAEMQLAQLCSGFDAGIGEPTDITIVAQTAFMLAKWLVGRPDEAVERGRLVISAAESLGDSFALAFALYGIGLLNAWRGNATQALECGQRALDVATEGHAVLLQHWARLLVGWAHTRLAPNSPAVRLDELLAQPRNSVSSVLYTLPIIEACTQTGREALALELISAAMDFMEQTDDRCAEPELHRLRGELLKSTNEHEAERCFVKAIAVAKHQASKSFELRAVISLYRLVRGVKQRKALENLRQLFETFTDGFETADLLEAKAILAR